LPVAERGDGDAAAAVGAFELLAAAALIVVAA
jgi:hypothetical protein